MKPTPLVVGDPNDASIRGPQWQRPDGFDPVRTTEGNDWYGSRQILLDYAGVDGNPVLPGRYQHGWQFGSGVDGETSATVGVYLQYKWPIWVWNNRNRTKAQHQGMRAKAIGAPVLYLPDEPDAGPIANALLAIPFHSNPPYTIRAGWEAYADVLSDLARDCASCTVLLHFRDYADAKPIFASRGMLPVTLGRLHGPDFLARLRYLIRKHELITGEHVHTASFYAQHFGRPYLVHGPALRALHDDGSTDQFAGPGSDPTFIARQFPAMLHGKIDMDTTAYELGTSEKRNPGELRELLGWF